MIEHKQRLNVHAKDAILQVLALDGAEEIDLALFESSKHDGGNGDVGRLLDVTRGVIVCAATVENDDFLFVGTVAAAASQLRDEAVLVDEFDLRVGHCNCFALRLHFMAT